MYGGASLERKDTTLIIKTGTLLPKRHYILESADTLQGKFTLLKTLPQVLHHQVSTIQIPYKGKPKSFYRIRDVTPNPSTKPNATPTKPNATPTRPNVTPNPSIQNNAKPTQRGI
jgi:hypothetical protein